MRSPRRLALLILVLAAVMLLRDQWGSLVHDLPWTRCEGTSCATPIAGAPVLSPDPTVTSAESTASEEPEDRSSLEELLERVPLPEIAPRPSATPTPIRLQDENTLVTRYGDESYGSFEEMPDELRYFIQYHVREISTFFGVRPEDVLAVLQSRNDGRYRIALSSDPRSENEGVARLSPRVWNGWANPLGEGYLTDLRSIERYGGIGFDWSMREMLRAWQAGRHDGVVLMRARARPERFVNSVAAIARYLEQRGLTATTAADDLDRHEESLADAIDNFDQLTALALAAEGRAPGVTSAPGEPSVPLRESYSGLMASAFGTALGDEMLAASVDQSAVAVEVAAGNLTPDDGARQLFNQTVASFMEQARAARAEGRPAPWPYIADEQSLTIQQLAVQLLGYPLTEWEIGALISEYAGDSEAIRADLADRDDARLYTSAVSLIDAGLKRTERGLPLRPYEVTRLVQPAVLRSTESLANPRALQAVIDDVDHYLRLLPEYQELNGVRVFSSTPMIPMPSRIIKPFGSPASYQTGGVHTGIDLRNQRVNGQEPPLFAVAEGVVAHVGPLYCDRVGACRGRYAIVLDHGNNVYSIYSHNSAAEVKTGDVVAPGQRIGQQGSEGYSRGPHLHFEVHVGAPYSGDWVTPFYGGEFVNPMPWLPRGSGS